MTRNSLYRITVIIHWEALCTERYTLIELHVITYYTCGTNHNTRAVIYSEMMANGGSRVDVYTSLRMSHFCYYTRDKRHTEQQELMS